MIAAVSQTPSTAQVSPTSAPSSPQGNLLTEFTGMMALLTLITQNPAQFGTQAQAQALYTSTIAQMTALANQADGNPSATPPVPAYPFASELGPIINVLNTDYSKIMPTGNSAAATYLEGRISLFLGYDPLNPGTLPAGNQLYKYGYTGLESTPEANFYFSVLMSLCATGSINQGESLSSSFLNSVFEAGGMYYPMASNMINGMAAYLAEGNGPTGLTFSDLAAAITDASSASQSGATPVGDFLSSLKEALIDPPNPAESANTYLTIVGVDASNSLLCSSTPIITTGSPPSGANLMVHTQPTTAVSPAASPTPSTHVKNPNMDAAGLLSLLALISTFDTSSLSGSLSAYANLWQTTVAKLSKLSTENKLAQPLEGIVQGALAIPGVSTLSTSVATSFSSYFNPSSGTSPFAELMNWFPSTSFDASQASSHDLASYCFIVMFAGTSTSFDGQTVNTSDPDCLLDQILGASNFTGSFAWNMIPFLNAYFADLGKKDPQLAGIFPSFLQNLKAAMPSSLTEGPNAYTGFFTEYYAEIQTDASLPPSSPTGKAALKSLAMALASDINVETQEGPLPTFFNPPSAANSSSDFEENPNPEGETLNLSLNRRKPADLLA